MCIGKKIQFSGIKRHRLLKRAPVEYLVLIGHFIAWFVLQIRVWVWQIVDWRRTTADVNHLLGCNKTHRTAARFALLCSGDQKCSSSIKGLASLFTRPDPTPDQTCRQLASDRHHSSTSTHTPPTPSESARHRRPLSTTFSHCCAL